MRGLLGTTFLVTAASSAAVVLYVSFTGPSASLHLDGAIPSTVVTGGYHVHSSRSDGTGSPDQIAAAAERAGLSFVVLTDHGDATRPPDPPSYRHNVLVIDAVEVSTSGGHVVALGLKSASAFPLAGQPRDVIDDIHRMGGKAVIAHPDSPRPDLRWRGQTQATAFDGIEWLNADSEWRDERPGRLFATAIRSVTRGPEAVASLFARPARSLERWDMAAARRPVFGLAALDAHASIPWRESEEPRQHTALARPTYETMFRTVAQAVQLDAPLSGKADDDASRVLTALTAGASFSIIRAFADPASLTFTAEQGADRVSMGGRLGVNEAATTTFRASIPPAPGARVTLLRDGHPIASANGGVQNSGPTAPGVYRVEAMLPGSAMPWIVSNPIVVGPTDGPPATSDETRLDGSSIPLPMEPLAWSVEREPESRGEVTLDDRALRFGFRLAPGQPSGQYAALVTNVATEAGVDRLQFLGRADRPMRISMQLRLPGGRDGQRWRRSVFLDSTPRLVTVSLQDFEPADPFTSQRPIVSRVRTLLFVVDTLNTLPGSEGAIWISNVLLGTRQP